ncbi:MAG: biotin/lipoyl-containing protein, partial [Ruminococcus sp.]|nr:biotin/lipoyl-containing protein [Ruminococcus sp.]
MYNIDEIKEFIKVLEDSSLSVLEIQKEDGSKIHLEKAQPAQVVNTVPAPAPAAVQPAPSAPAVAEEVKAPVATDNAKTINAPIVGVFYVAPAPGKDPYVSVGKKVKKGDTVCIIEAMK